MTGIMFFSIIQAWQALHLYQIPPRISQTVFEHLIQFYWKTTKRN